MIIGAVAIALALTEARMIIWLMLFAWSGIASAFTPVLLCSLFWKRTTRAGAIAGMITGFVTTVAWVLLFKEKFYDLYELLPGFFAGLAATVAVSLVTEPPEGAGEEFEDVHREVGHPFRRPQERRGPPEGRWAGRALTSPALETRFRFVPDCERRAVLAPLDVPHR